MKVRLWENEHCDTKFQIEFNSIQEIKELSQNLASMHKYLKLCQEDGEEDEHELIYKVEKGE